MPLTLSQALDLARARHPLLHSSQAGVALKEALETESRSPLWPLITFQSAYQRANSRGGTFGASFPFTIYDSIFSLSQLLTDFGKTGAQVRATKQAVVQARQNLQYNLQLILLGVYQAYYQVLENQALAQVEEKAVFNLRRHLEEAENLFRIGTRPKIEVIRAQVNLSNERLNLIQAQNNLRLSESSLRKAIGDPDLQSFQAADELRFTPFEVRGEEAATTAYLQRPDLRALESELEGAKATLQAASRGQNPTLSGSASYGWRDSVFPPRSISWGLGLSLNVQLFNGFLTQGQAAEKKALVDQLQAQIDQVRLNIGHEVTQAHLTLQAARTSLEVAEDGVRFARESFELADGRYRAGVGTALEFYDAEVSLVQAESRRVQALSRYLAAVAALRQAMGVLR